MNTTLLQKLMICFALILALAGLTPPAARAANLCQDVLSAQTQKRDFSEKEISELKKIFETRIFDQENYYKLLQEHPEKIRQLIQKWYGAKFLKEWAPKVRFENLDASVLLLDPGIADRIGEFVGFSSDYLQHHHQTSIPELRKAFSLYLGKRTVYRAVILTEAQAADVRRTGLQAPGLFFKTDTAFNWFEKSNSGPVHDFVKRVQKDDGTTGMTLSVSDYKEVALAAAGYRIGAAEPHKSIYLFEIVSDEINIVRENQRISTTPAFRKLKEALKDGALILRSPEGVYYNAAWEVGGAESFLLNYIPPSEFKSVTKIEDRRAWGIEMIGSARGTQSLDMDDPPPKRPFQVLEDPDGYFPY